MWPRSSRRREPLSCGAFWSRSRGVRVSPDFGYAKIYVSVFPFDRSAELMKTLEQQNWFVRRALGQRLRNQLKNVPEIQFFLDDSLEYIEHIEQALK